MKRILSFGLLIFEKVRIPATYIIILCLAYGSRTFVRAERSKLRQENLPFYSQIELTSCRPPNLMTMVGLNGLVITRLSIDFGCFNWVDTHVSSQLLKLCIYIYIHIIENHFGPKEEYHYVAVHKRSMFLILIELILRDPGRQMYNQLVGGGRVDGPRFRRISAFCEASRVLCLLNQCWMKHTLNLENWVLRNTFSGIWILKLNPCWKQTKGAKVIPSTIQH